MSKCNAIPPPDFKFPVKFIFLLFNIGTSLVTILGNSLVMVALPCTPRLKTRSNYFLVLLAGTDLAVGLIARPTTCLLVIDVLYMRQICTASNLQAYICTVSCGASMGMLAVTGYDRYRHLSRLKNYNKYMTNGNLKVLISMIFVYQTLVGCLIFHEDTAESYSYFAIGHVGTYSTILSFYYYNSWKIAKKEKISTTDERIKKQWRIPSQWLYLS